MNYLKGVTVYFWSANHIALKVNKIEHIYNNGAFTTEQDEDSNPICQEQFRALTHSSDFELACTSDFVHPELKDLINTWFDNKKAKEPSFIEDFWEDCSHYIRDDQIELLKALYQIMLEHHVFDDDDDLEEGYDDDEIPEHSEEFKKLGIDVTTGKEKRHQSLIKAQMHEALIPLVEQLRENKTALENKYLILDFLEQLKTQKGLGIDVEGMDEHTMFGKLPKEEWSLPLGNSLTLDNTSSNYLDNLNLFGLSLQGIESGIKKFANPEDIIHQRAKETYYKFFSRYHNCAGYSRYLLEQGGITAYRSTNELEQFGVTDPALFQIYMTKVCEKIASLNTKARELMKNAHVTPQPLVGLDCNYLAGFKKGNPLFDGLPPSLRNAVSEYNKELIHVSYEHKIKLLINLLKIMHRYRIKQPEIVDAFQKEVRRNFEINFDAQFSYNYSFQLKCLGTLAALSVGGLVVGIIAAVCPPLLLIPLAALVVVTAVAGTSALVTLGLFATKLIPPKPACEHNYANLSTDSLAVDKK